MSTVTLRHGCCCPTHHRQGSCRPKVTLAEAAANRRLLAAARREGSQRFRTWEIAENAPTSAACYVYRLWDANGQCLYVGMVGGTRGLRERIREHRQGKPWFREVARLNYIECGPDAVNDEEKRQIAELRPLHNIQHNRSAR